MESEESSGQWDHGGPSSSRYQQQVGRELTAANLARLDEQPLVRGPLKQYEEVSKQTMASVLDTNMEIDRLNESIRSLQGHAIFLSEHIQAALEGTELGRQGEDGQVMELSDLRWLQNQLANTQGRILQDQARIQYLQNRLNQGTQSVDRGLHRMGLATTGGANQPSYPAHADLGEDTEGIAEEARPHLYF